jgi:septum formation protein
MKPAYRLILASKSPRRRQLLEELGWEFEVRTREVDESYPPELKGKEVALYLAELKAKAFDEVLDENTVVITADTIVCVDDLILGKPVDQADALRMLSLLSGREHEVITAVCIHSSRKLKSFAVTTRVQFKNLREEEALHYVTAYRPFDKAGAYGIQEWIGLTGISGIHGSYFNVVGLPVKELYEELLKF